MKSSFKHYIGTLKKDMKEWKDEDYGLHAILAKQGTKFKLMQMYFDGEKCEVGGMGGGLVIMEPANDEDLPLFKKTVLKYAKENWCVDDEVTEEQFFGEEAERYCDCWLFGLEEFFFETLEEVEKGGGARKGNYTKSEGDDDCDCC